MSNIVLNDDYIKENLASFLNIYNIKEKEEYWNKKSQEFHLFWNNKIKNSGYILKQTDTDDLVRIIDSKARGHESDDEVIARTGIYQGLWEKAINDLKTNQALQGAFDKIINCGSLTELSVLIDNFLMVNRDGRNGLSGDGANMINAFLFLKDPNIFLSIISLRHRDLIINKFGFDSEINYKSLGEKIVKTNFEIIEGFNKKYNVLLNPRTLSEFLYTPHNIYTTKIKNIWYEGSSFKYRVRNNEGKDVKIKMSDLMLKQFFISKKQKRTLDYVYHKNIKEQQENNDRIGKKGEELILNLEKERLLQEGHPELSDKVKIVSEDYSLGYDVLSYNCDGTERYIEVKSTTSGLNHGQFYISANELSKSKILNNYYLYFVFKIDKIPEVKMLAFPELDNNKYFELIPQSFLVKYKIDN